MWNCVYQRPTIKSWADFRLCGGSIRLTPALFKGQLYFTFCVLCSELFKWIISCSPDTTQFFLPLCLCTYCCLLLKLSATASICFPSSRHPAHCALLPKASTQAPLTDHHLLKLHPFKFQLKCPLFKTLFLPAHAKLTLSLSPLRPVTLL